MDRRAVSHAMDVPDFLMNWEEDGGGGDGGGGPSHDGRGAAAAAAGPAAMAAAATAAPAPQHPKRQWDPSRASAASAGTSAVSLGASLGATHASSNTSGCASGATAAAGASSSSGGTAASRAPSADAAAAAAAHFLRQGHIHPLAMTSLASCPPYASGFGTLPTPGAGGAQGAQGSGSAQGVGQGSSQRNAQGSAQGVGQGQGGAAAAGATGNPMLPPSQPFVPRATTRGTVFNFPSIVTNANDASPHVLPGGANQNAAFAAHLSELAANFHSSSAAAATSLTGHTSLHGHVPAPLHFGMTVNGFHPQVNAQVNPVLPPLPLPGLGGVGGLSGGGASGSLLGVGGVAAAAAAAKPPAAASVPPRRTASLANHTASSYALHRPSPHPGNAPALSEPATTHQRNARDRNEREQVRAKKITQLITELRVHMQRGGWKEEMKSKYQTLSQCREYVAHLQRAHAAKERDIARTKRLAAEKAALREARADAEGAARSDPRCEEHDPTASVTSSLTDSTARSTSSGANEMDCSSTSSGERSEEGGSKPRAPAAARKRTSADLAAEEGEGKPPADEVPAKKKSRKSSRRTKRNKKPAAGGGRSSEEASSASEDGDDGGNESPGGKNIQFDKTSSSVSDMTDSNRSSTNGANVASGGGGGGEGSTSSISSTAAVVRGVGSSRDSGPSRRRKRHGTLPAVTEEGKDGLLRGGGKAFAPAGAAAGSKGAAATGPPAIAAGAGPAKKKRRGFHYDYREVFVKSNVPQVIATLSGRIVVWNEFFLTATGLSERDAKRLTIFGIVESDQLSSLYKMVARALAAKGAVPSRDAEGSTSGPATSGAESSSGPAASSGAESSSAAKSERTDADEGWQAITLKCVPFPSRGGAKGDGAAKPAAAEATHHPNPLYITVALMEDERRDQRCFHCVLTDCPGTRGKLGSVTPELFALLFASGKKNSAPALAKTEIAMYK